MLFPSAGPPAVTHCRLAACGPSLFRPRRVESRRRAERGPMARHRFEGHGDNPRQVPARFICHWQRSWGPCLSPPLIRARRRRETLDRSRRASQNGEFRRPWSENSRSGGRPSFPPAASAARGPDRSRHADSKSTVTHPQCLVLTLGQRRC